MLLVGGFNDRYSTWDKNCKAPNKNGKTFKDIMSWHIVQIQNDQNSTYVHKRGSITIDLVLKRGVSNWKCQTKEFDHIDNCQKGIITTSHNERLIVNKKIQNQGC